MKDARYSFLDRVNSRLLVNLTTVKEDQDPDKHEDYNANDMNLRKIRIRQLLLNIENSNIFRILNDRNFETCRIESRVVKIS